MKTITINIYEFSELSPKAKNQALIEMSDINMDNWWNFIYEDANNTNLSIKNFDLDRQEINGAFINGAIDTANLILQNHGESTVTYILAMNYLSQEERAEDPEELEEKFLEDLLAEYKDMLQKDYDFYQSDEAIIETIEANDYLFYENGKQYTPSQFLLK
jgi:uncharacterized protein YaaN involved in tellurite resistance